MSHPDHITLNISYLKNRTAELGLKQWWLAEQVGVDRKTVNRWLQGQVRSIQIGNAKALAQVLNCRIEDLSLTDESSQLASAEDQKHAAQLLASSSVVEKLGPIGEWNVIESLLKATLVSGLPLQVLGDLYDQLTIASWRQSKIDQADIYNKKTKEIALQLNDKSLLAKATLSEANIYSWRGEIKKSIDSYISILSMERFVSSRLLAATHSNLGGILYESGEIELGLKHIEKSIQLFLTDGTAMNLSISHCHMTFIYLQKNDLDLAETHLQKSMDLAAHSDYRRGIFIGHLIQSEISARRGNKDESKQLLTKGLDGFRNLNIEEGLNYELAGRICRLNQDFGDSINYLEKGISISNEFPLYQAALYFELALTLKNIGKDHSQSLKQSIQLYKKCGALKRIELIDVP
jgi:tetratricopeptide (TPR) repeat protein